jgi:uncharacterized protein
MTLIDVNILLYAEDATSAHHGPVRLWWERLLASGKPVAFTWTVLLGFLRVATNQRILSNPLSAEEACTRIEEWLAVPAVSVLEPGSEHWASLSRLARRVPCTGDLVPDAHLAALAMEHGCELASCDTDFGKFPGLRWINPLAP